MTSSAKMLRSTTAWERRRAPVPRQTDVILIHPGWSRERALRPFCKTWIRSELGTTTVYFIYLLWFLSFSAAASLAALASMIKS